MATQIVTATAPLSARKPEPPRVRLYIAKNTPASTRAERNLLAALRAEHGGGALRVEIIDVFSNAKRAEADGVIVAPTLVALGRHGRAVVMGDLSNTEKLLAALESL